MFNSRSSVSHTKKDTLLCPGLNNCSILTVALTPYYMRAGGLTDACMWLYLLPIRNSQHLHRPSRLNQKRKTSRIGTENLKKIFLPTFNGLTINTNSTMGWGCYVAILDGIYRQLVNLQSHDSRIQVIRFDIRLPSKQIYDVKEENRQLRAFFKCVKENLALKRWGGRRRVVHGWVREVGHTNHGHYHAFMAFKRLTVRFGTFSRERYTGLWEMLRRCSKRITGANLRFCPVVHVLERGDATAFNNCFYHLSYLAKLRDKEFGTGSRHKLYDFSRLKHKDASAISP